MTQEGEEWFINLLKFLHTHYTAWDVPLNTFLEEDLKMGIDDEAQGKAFLRFLKELESQRILTSTFQPGLDEIGRPPTLKNYKWNARLTLDGLKYISDIIRAETQIGLTKQLSSSTIETNRSFRLLNKHTKAYYNIQKCLGFSIVAFTAVSMVLGVATYFKVSPAPVSYPTQELQLLKNRQSVLDSILKAQIMIDSLRDASGKKNSSKPSENSALKKKTKPEGTN